MENSQKLGLCWGSVPGGTLIDIATSGAANGFACITITPGHYIDARAAGLGDGEIRARLSDLGIRVSVIDPLIGVLPGTPAPGEVDPSMRRFFTYSEEDCRRAAAGVEAPTINLAHFLGRPIETAALQDKVGEIAGRNRDAGFSTTLEFIPGTGVPNLATALSIVADIPHAGIMFDTWHFARSDGTLDELVALPPHAIGGMQISDRIPPAPGEPYVPMAGRLCPGEGELPLATMLALIEKSSPGLDICLEVFSEELKAMGWGAAGARMARTGRAALASAARELAHDVA
ncbi:sugar phosphate isomerase/epimerase family protein [Flavisphingomonas formosensis]|uniref:sugar phosphate isomerase/epimerase family protein n=1 Tax=Flavisphingomonas formosensis TaxID=861534 RepID=UPI0012FC615B|nr:TIM barrel protein [Sphingomonas formosensis]